MDSRQPSPYIFDKHKLRIPHYMSVIIPPDIHDGIRIAREKAGAAFQALKELERLRRERYYRLCPSNDLNRYETHSMSVNRLLEWEHPADHRADRDPFLSLRAKIPICVVNFHINEEAYKMFYSRYERVRLGYLNGSFTEWNRVKKGLSESFKQCEMGELDKKLCLDWWKGFQREMQIWERRVLNLPLPKWNEIVRELADMIEKRVDLENDWENTF